MRNIDPDGMHMSMSSDISTLLAVEAEPPDVLWLYADDVGYYIADRVYEINPKAKFGFISKDPKVSTDSARLHGGRIIADPITEELILKELDELGCSAIKTEPTVKVSCFGNFEVFINGKPMKFSRSRSKEALAYLIDRKGASCTVKEICTVLWENRPADEQLESQCRVILYSLKKDLASIGAEKILIKTKSSWSIDPEAITCDYYDALNGNLSNYIYCGEYMSQYSWSEETNGWLYQAFIGSL